MTGQVAPVGPVTRERPAPPVRIVHLGLGAFNRAHSAWYTAHAPDAADWGIAAYTGSSTELARALNDQQGVYTLVARSADGDRAESIENIVRAHPGTDLDRFVADVAAPETAIITLTITESGYGTGGFGTVDSQGAVDSTHVAEKNELAKLRHGGDLHEARPRTTLGRLVVGLEARRRAGSGPLAIVSCDNLPDNGGVLRRTLLELANATPQTRYWCRTNVSFVSSSVDRITPRLSDEELARLTERFGDRIPVVTEPFSDWVLAGRFPAGRPAWEQAGARFTRDLEPWEARKLWLLNGAHTLLASLGTLRGHHDIAEAISDPACRAAVEAYWDEAARHLPERLDIDTYRRDLLTRFSNPRIVHLLSQIVLDTPTKLRLRIAPVAERERERGRSAAACAEALASWLVLDGHAGGDAGSIKTAVAGFSKALSRDEGFTATATSAVQRLHRLTLP